MRRRAIADNRSREERQPGRVQTHEHNLRVARPVLLIVQLLEALHCLQAEWCGRAVESEEIGCEIQGHVRDRLMTARYLRKNVDENRAEYFCDAFCGAAVDQQLHETGEERQVRS